MKSSTQKQISKQSVIAGPGGTKYSGITKAEMDSVLGIKKLKKNANMTINIGNDSYRVTSSPGGHGKTVVSVMEPNGYSLYRDTYTSSGSYGYASSSTKSTVLKEVQEVILRKYKVK